MKDWRSAGDTSDDYYKTWSDLHIAHWDGIRRPALPVLPLTPTKIHIIGALLKLVATGQPRTTSMCSRRDMWKNMEHGELT